jgi:hypothetical protein
MIDEPGHARFELLGRETPLSASPFIRRWRRRPWSAVGLRPLKQRLATEACQWHSEDADSGHLVLRLMGSFLWFYPSRVLCKGRLSMEEILFRLQHYWRFGALEALGFHALS